jgi:hypothetical protein
MQLHNRSVQVVDNPAFDPSSNLFISCNFNYCKKKQMMATRHRQQGQRSESNGGSLSETRQKPVLPAFRSMTTPPRKTSSGGGKMSKKRPKYKVNSIRKK